MKSLAAISPEFDAICKKNRVVRLRLFGSAVSGEQKPQSDIDVLVDFEPGFSAELKTYEVVEQAISALFQFRPVDLIRTELLHWFVRDSIIDSAVTFYER